ncbi:ATP-binding protein, partial [Brevibacillus agri]
MYSDLARFMPASVRRFVQVEDIDLRKSRVALIRRLLDTHQMSDMGAALDFGAVTFPAHCSRELLTDLAFLERKENVMMLGKVGTGKTHLATAPGVEACRRGYEVRFFRVHDLVAALQDKYHSGTLSRFQRELQKAEFLILDEMG